MCCICSSINIKSIDKLRKTGGKPFKGRMITYGYRYVEHSCNDCNHKWEVKKDF